MRRASLKILALFGAMVLALSCRSVGARTIQIEAESMTLDNYRVEENAFASRGKFISLLDSALDVGQATTKFTGESGDYILVVYFLDEEDGVGRIELLLNGTAEREWFLNLHLGENGPGEQAFTARKVGTITVKRGDTITIRGTRAGSENARVDFLQFIPTTAIFEAETAERNAESKVSSRNPGYTGTGYVDVVGEGYIQWLVDDPTAGAGDYVLEFRYAMGKKDDPGRPMNIQVNGRPLPGRPFPNTVFYHRWLSQTVIASLQEGENTIRAVTAGSSGANMDHLSVTPVRYLDAAKGSTEPAPNAYLPNDNNDVGYSDTYYGRVDPNGERSTLDKWRIKHEFNSAPPGSIVSASYINAHDLGFGRKMFCLGSSPQTPCYVENYVDPKGASPRLVAIVAMERINPDTDDSYVAFFAYDRDGRRINQIALDGEGPKSDPESCFACHGGTLAAAGLTKTGG